MERYQFVSNAPMIAGIISETLSLLGIERRIESLKNNTLGIGNIRFEILEGGVFDRRYVNGSNEVDASPIKGFAKHNVGKSGLNAAIVRAGELFQVISTTGHEIGHALTEGVEDFEEGEETKAQAFEMAWDLAIERGNIGKLGSWPLEYFKGKKYDEERYPVHLLSHRIVKRRSRFQDPLDIYEEIARCSVRSN